MAIFALKMACPVCGEPASRWCDAAGFIHVACVPLRWFERKGWRTGEPALVPAQRPESELF